MKITKGPFLAFLVLMLVSSLFPPRTLELVRKGTESSVLKRQDLGHGFLYTAEPVSEYEYAYYRVTTNWDQFFLELCAGTALVFLGFSISSFIRLRRPKDTSSAPEETHQAVNTTTKDTRNIFTDDIVRDILSGQVGVMINGKGYLVHKDCLVSADKIRHYDSATDSSMLIGTQIPFPEELKKLLIQREQERHQRPG